jgi:hypothetical protein
MPDKPEKMPDNISPNPAVRLSKNRETAYQAFDRTENRLLKNRVKSVSRSDWAQAVKNKKQTKTNTILPNLNLFPIITHPQFS